MNGGHRPYPADGRHSVNPSAFVIHSAIHTLRADAEAAAHAHTTHSGALGALSQTLEPLDQESAAFYQDQVLYDDYRRPVDCRGAGQRHCGKARHRPGHPAASPRPDHRRQHPEGGSALLAAAAGRMQPMTHEQAIAAKDGFGDAQLAWFSFQLLYDEIVREQPDLLDE